MNLSQELTERGFIHQFSAASLADIVDGEKRTIYHGIDPSADSAHAGNMVIWLLLRRLAEAGHKIIFLVGGGTGLIGDPKPNVERDLKTTVSVAHNVEGLKKQAKKFFGDQEVEFVNNLDWLGELKFIDFLRDIGKHYTVNELIKKEAVATRLQSDAGLSYTEFAYPLMQGYDYYQLFKTKNCMVQIGGSDQWGNIISGVELVRRKAQAEVFAITVPLIVDKATGKKFGKSEGNAVWLDAKKTSPYEFYQFWLNVADDSVVEYLKLFTFISLEKIKEIEQGFTENPNERLAQKTLALAVTEIVHGKSMSEASQKVSKILFSTISLDDLSDLEKEVLVNNAPTAKVAAGDVLVDVLLDTGLASSKREARTFIESGAVVLGGKKITDVNTCLSDQDFVSKLSFLRKGKKNLCILKLS